MKRVITILPMRYKMSIQNLIGHPVSEVFHILGMDKIALYIHDVTLPEEEKNDQSTTKQRL